MRAETMEECIMKGEEAKGMQARAYAARLNIEIGDRKKSAPYPNQGFGSGSGFNQVS
jgi:hypothetical protein